MLNFRFARESDVLFAWLMACGLACFSLVACASAGPSPSSTPEMVMLAATATPTSTSTLSLTPTPTVVVRSPAPAAMSMAEDRVVVRRPTPAITPIAEAAVVSNPNPETVLIPTAADIGTATALSSSRPVLGDLQLGGEVDFFAFEAETDDVATIHLDYNIIGGIALRLYDAEGRILDHSEYTGYIWDGQPFDFAESKRIRRRLPATGTYYVSVFSLYSNQLGYYRLSLGLENVRDYPWRAPFAGAISNVLPFPSRFDVGVDYRESATPVVVGESASLVTEGAAVIKTFKFETLESEIYTITVSGDYHNFGLLVLDPNGEVVSETYGYEVERIMTTSFATSLSGTYFVAVQAEDWVGRPKRGLTLFVELDDHSGELAFATPIKLGERINAQGNDLDFFKFTAQKGSVYSIDVDIDNIVHRSTQLALYTPNELILASLAGEGQRLPFKWRAKASGIHYLTILNSADYTLTVDSVEDDERDDFGDDVTTVTQLVVGQDVEGVIEINGDIDIFRFTAEEGEAYVINLVSDLENVLSGYSYSRFAAIVELLTSDGIILLRSPTGRSNWGYEARMLWEPPASGEYYLKVYSNWRADEVVGDYLLNVEVSTYKDRHKGSIYDATALVIGESQDGFIGCHDDVDTFKFQGKAKTAYRVMLEKEYTAEIGIEVHDGTGIYLGPRQHYKKRNYEFGINLPWSPGWDVPRCVDFQANPEPDFVQEMLFFAHNDDELFVHLDAKRIGHNRYSITVEEDEYRDDHGDQKATATNIRLGEIMDGELNLTGESDVFKFSADEGQIFEFELSFDTLPNACILLVPENDAATEEWCTWSISGSESLESYVTAWLAPSNGDFYLVVQSEDLGAYSLRVEPIDFEDDHSNDHNQATEVHFSVPVQGRIDTSDDIDVFAFDAEDGDVIQLTLNHDALDQIDVDLYDSIHGEYLWGTVEDVDYDLSQLDTNQTVRRIWRTVRAGTHYLAVKAVSVGRYSVNLTRAEYQDDFGNNPVDAQVISMNVEIDGKFEVIGDVDFFAFRAEVGEVYSMKVTSPTIERPQFNLLDAEGTRVNPYFGNEFQWQATSTGTFYIATFVREFDQDTGSYKLVANRLQDDDHGYDLQTATPLMLDSVIRGEMSWPDDTDFFKFEAVKDLQYFIDLDRGGKDGFALVLFDPQGGQIAREIHVDDIIWTASISATHYIAIEPSWNRASYSIVVTMSDYKDDHGDSFQDATRISVGESIDGYLAWRDLDFFKFNVESGRSYHIDFERETVHFASTWSSRLLDVDGENVEWTYSEIDDKTYRMTFQADNDETYYVAVDAYRGRGTYTINFGSSD